MSERPNFLEIAVNQVAEWDATASQAKTFAEFLERMYDQGFEAGGAAARASASITFGKLPDWHKGGGTMRLLNPGERADPEAGKL